MEQKENIENKEVEKETTISKNTDSSTDDISNNKNNNVQENETEFDNKEDEEEIEFDDSDTADQEESKPKTNSQNYNSRRDDKRFAKSRKAYEQDLHSSYLKGVKVATGEINPYTKEKMDSDDDIQVYLDMKEMDRQGLDPTNSSDYIKYTREKQKIEIEQKEKEQKAINQYQKDIIEFQNKYPNINIEKMINESENWANLILPQIRQGKTLTQAYENISNIINENANSIAEERLKKQKQNSYASPGSLTNGEGNNNQEIKIDYKNMPTEEFNKMWKEELDNI